MSNIRSKKPKVLGARVAGLRLTPEERFVMARIDGKLSVTDLVALTGLEEQRLEQIVSKLAFDGAVDLGEEPRFAPPPASDGGTTSMADLAAALGMDPSQFAGESAKPAAPALRRPVIRPVARPEPAIAKQDVKPEVYDDAEDDAEDAEPAVAAPEPEPSYSSPALSVLDDDDLPEVEDALNAAAFDAFVEPEETADRSPASKRMDELEEVIEDEPPPEEEAAPPAEPDAASDKEAEITRAVAERNYRQLYERHWHPLTPDARIAGAKTAHGPDLLALCFDPDPRIIAAVLENHSVGLDHVRLIAFYHRTGTGLEILARRQEWLRDILVERRLLRNPMIGDIVLGRVMGPKRLFQTYKIAIDREIPDLSRNKVRGLIRQKWQKATSEERAELLFRTEARCLIVMTGCTFDAKTTAILCGRPINSVMFVQSIAKFPASPPGLLAHLMKQPFVRKNMPLKKMLLSHPNMPGDVKRNI